MAKYKKKHHRSGSKKIPLAVVVPLALPVIAAGRVAIAGGNGNDVIYQLMGIGQSGGHSAVNTEKALSIGVPIVAGVLVHKFIGKHVNRYIPKSIPFGV